MKRNRWLILGTMITLILVSVSVASTEASVLQTDNEIVMVQDIPMEIPTPETIWDGITNFEAWTGAFVPLVGLTVFLTGFLIGLFKITGPGLKQLLSWGVGILLVMILNLIGIGAPEGLLWYSALIYGFVVSLAANHVFDIGLLNSILEALKLPHKKYWG